jgi:cobalt-zinc-cadmium efflux system membrane fusion protein
MKNFITLILVGLLISACGNDKKVDQAVTEIVSNSISLNNEQIVNSDIREAAPKKELIGMTIHANGTVEVPPQNKTIIAAQFGGFIKSLNVLDGMNVKKGQVLLTIEHPELIQLQQDFLEVSSSLEYLAADLDRQVKLSQQEAGSLKNMQLAKSQYTGAMAKKSGLKVKLEMAGVNISQLSAGNIQRSVSILAPFSGVVTKVAVEVGAYANPTDNLLEIIDLKHAHAEVIVFEKDVKKLKIGQQLTLNFSNEVGVVKASIFLIGKEIATDRTVKVHCHLDEESASIAPGSYFKASIYTGETEEYCVPSQAIVELNGKLVVFFVKSKTKNATTYIPEEVRVLSTDKERTAIEFLNQKRSLNDKLVISGAYEIMSAILIKGEE